MSFKFRLQKVLDYRAQLEDQAKQALAGARLAREREEATLKALKAEYAEQRARMSASAAMTGAERWLAQSYMQALDFDIGASAARLARLWEEENECREKLVAAARERKLLEKLKAKQAIRYAEEEKLKEQRENDETATIRYQRQTV